MSFRLQPSTWRLLGLSVGIGYGLFGAVHVLRPRTITKHLLGLPSEPSEQADRVISVMAPLLGARDITVAALIFGFHHMRKYREMGIVIVAGTILCCADAVAVWAGKGPRLALQMAVGATNWTWIGWGLTLTG
ncbi:hypothetical protein VTK56DRAFT_5665 [Thermocarpiscus australiensis]